MPFDAVNVVPAFTPVVGEIAGAAVDTGTCPERTRATFPAFVWATQILVSGPSARPAGREFGLVKGYSARGAPWTEYLATEFRADREIHIVLPTPLAISVGPPVTAVSRKLPDVPGSVFPSLFDPIMANQIDPSILAIPAG